MRFLITCNSRFFALLALWCIFVVTTAPLGRDTLHQVGTDIQDNKCSWLVVQALQRATKAQKAVLTANYAIDEEDKVLLCCTACIDFCLVIVAETFEKATSISQHVANCFAFLLRLRRRRK